MATVATDTQRSLQYRQGVRPIGRRVRRNATRAIRRERRNTSYKLAEDTFDLFDKLVKRARQRGGKAARIPRIQMESEEHTLVRMILGTDARPGSTRALIEEELLLPSERGLRYIGHRGKGGKIYGKVAIIR